MQNIKRRKDLKNLIGESFHYWSVIGYDDSKSINRHSYWFCECKCGEVRSVRADQLRSLKSKSCGCHKKEAVKKRAFKHGMCETKIHKRWTAMRQRCSNPKSSRYENYGAKGIKVCKEWDDFNNFYNWAVENGYSEDLIIDRIDNNGNYEPSNCRFISNKAQQLNKSTNRLVTIGLITMTVIEWCSKYKINRSTFAAGLNNGWVGKDLLKRGD